MVSLHSNLPSPILLTYPDFITHFVSSQLQADANYFDLSSAFDLVPHTCFFVSTVLLNFMVVT
jgi:hypothetical protein